VYERYDEARKLPSKSELEHYIWATGLGPNCSGILIIIRYYTALKLSFENLEDLIRINEN
jgi:hypothetical protein